MIDYATFQRIHHLHRVEQLTVAQIAFAMAMDARTVRRWLDEPQLRARATPTRPSKLDPYKAYIRRLLEHHPYSAAQLLNRLREAGYVGGVTIVKDYVQRVRPVRAPAFLTLHFAPGAALEWMTIERIAPVRGNHDQLMITALACDDGELRNDGPSQWWDAIGGDWWYRDRDRDSKRWDHEERLAEECGRWLGALRNVPFVRTIESNCGRIGIVHTLGPTRTGPGAQASNDWATLETRLDALTREAHGKQPLAPALSMPKAVDDILWGRPEIEREDRNAMDLPAPMQGIDLVITGHTPGRRPRWTRQNVLCIDTGVFVPEYGHLTIAEIQTGTARAHRFAEVEGRRL